MSMVGTVIRCQKCKCAGHNRASCGKRSGTATPTATPSATPSAEHSAAGPSAPVPSAPLAQSTPMSTNPISNNSKRKLSCNTDSRNSIGTVRTSKKVTLSCQEFSHDINVCNISILCVCLQAKTLGLVHTKAKTRVSTTSAGTTSLNLHARTPNSAATSSVTISIKAGSASAQCSAQEPVKKQQSQNASTSKLPMLLLPPWDFAKL